MYIFNGFRKREKKVEVIYITKLFVGGLPFATTDAELNELFAKFGQVQSAAVIMDRMTNRSRGFGFVEMVNDEEAQAAINALNESDFEGRKIVVSVARPREDRPQRDGGFNRNNDRRGGFQDRNRDRNRRPY